MLFLMLLSLPRTLSWARLCCLFKAFKNQNEYAKPIPAPFLMDTGVNDSDCFFAFDCFPAFQNKFDGTKSGHAKGYRGNLVVKLYFWCKLGHRQLLFDTDCNNYLPVRRKKLLQPTY